MQWSGCVERCPGCAHRDMPYRESVAAKAAWLDRALARWSGRIADVATAPVEQTRGYRDRVCLAAGWDGRWRLGLVRDERVVAIPDCPVHSPRVGGVVRLLERILPPPSRLPLVYLVQSGAQVTLVVKSTVAATEWFDAAVAGALAGLGVEGLWLHLFPSAGRKRILHKREWRLLWGEPRSRDGSGFAYGPAAFQQLLPALYRRSLDEAAAFLAPGPGDGVVDLYCGRGATLVEWCRRGARTVGVELGGEAVACARLNAPEAVLLRGSCEARLPQLSEWVERVGGERLLYLNPPRTGVEARVADWIANSHRPRRIAYLSCSAGTLARDLGRLESAGYRVERIAPYDFFPWTYHVETLALLSR